MVELTTLTQNLAVMTHQQACVLVKRRDYLAALGLFELIANKGLAAAELLAHAAYQNSLKSTPEKMKVLGTPAVANLKDVLTALKTARQALVDALNVFLSDSTGAHLAGPGASDVIRSEHAHCKERLAKIDALAKVWQKSIDDYLKLYPKDALHVVPDPTAA